VIGHRLARSFGSSAHIVGGLLLIASGGQATWAAARAEHRAQPPTTVATAHAGRLLLLAAALSIDNLIVGFALGTYHAGLVLSVAVIAGVSVGLSLVGLELGSRLGARVEHNSEIIGGVVLIAVGVAILTKLL